MGKHCSCSELASTLELVLGGHCESLSVMSSSSELQHSTKAGWAGEGGTSFEAAVQSDTWGAYASPMCIPIATLQGRDQACLILGGEIHAPAACRPGFRPQRRQGSEQQLAEGLLLTTIP